jgi:hypothetical protein
MIESLGNTFNAVNIVVRSILFESMDCVLSLIECKIGKWVVNSNNGDKIDTVTGV